MSERSLKPSYQATLQSVLSITAFKIYLPPDFQDSNHVHLQVAASKLLVISVHGEFESV